MRKFLFDQTVLKCSAIKKKKHKLAGLNHSINLITQRYDLISYTAIADKNFLNYCFGLVNNLKNF